jgi:hypothetical protein
MHLRDGRLRDLVEHNLREGAALICHKTTYGQLPDLGEVVCAGWFKRYGERTNVIRVMARLAALNGEDGDGFEHVPPPTEVTPGACSMRSDSPLPTVPGDAP